VIEIGAPQADAFVTPDASLAGMELDRPPT
jgi:hypothetical protein